MHQLCQRAAAALCQQGSDFSGAGQLVGGLISSLSLFLKMTIYVGILCVHCRRSTQQNRYSGTPCQSRTFTPVLSWSPPGPKASSVSLTTRPASLRYGQKRTKEKHLHAGACNKKYKYIHVFHILCDRPPTTPSCRSATITMVTAPTMPNPKTRIQSLLFIIMLEL